MEGDGFTGIGHRDSHYEHTLESDSFEAGPILASYS